MNGNKNILLLEPSKSTADTISKYLNERGNNVFVATTTDDAMKIADTESMDIVISEIMLPHHSGTEFLYEFRSYPDWQHVPCLVYTSMRLPHKILQSCGWKALQINAYLYKPDCDLAHLLVNIEDALQDETN